MKKNKGKERLQIELEAVSRRGITLWLGEELSNPEEIAEAHTIAEPGEYMRDYVQNKDGKITKIRFDKIKNQ
ncbi:hypothetical protein [Anaerosacchariphilus polymeriproducens]|uniref:Uncharacterized protein n=1 Tax=Anaerosacchariphilus polymeriproducens TaxID=1812858 RepID=A0A371AY26_9FIRM|nr:hypothetical protein [Anaerosacchariphilus polymeriproducens]RDU24457.1 hypothetical protein DWV06_02990 [Anaerosacchariphilus polymeriproducens]